MRRCSARRSSSSRRSPLISSTCRLCSAAVSVLRRSTWPGLSITASSSLDLGTHQRLPSRTTLVSMSFVSLDGPALLRKLGDTFHCRPSSVMTVTVFLL